MRIPQITPRMTPIMSAPVFDKCITPSHMKRLQTHKGKFWIHLKHTFVSNDKSVYFEPYEKVPTSWGVGNGYILELKLSVTFYQAGIKQVNTGAKCLKWGLLELVFGRRRNSFSYWQKHDRTVKLHNERFIRLQTCWVQSFQFSQRCFVWLPKYAQCSWIC